MARIETRPFDAAEYVKTPEDVAYFLEESFKAAREDGHAGFIADALGVVARSQGMAEIAERTGLSRETLYRSLSVNGNPTLTTLIEVLAALGLRLSVAPLEAESA